MTRWLIDTDRSSFRVTFQPGLPGVGLSIRGVTGTFVADLDDRGQPDLDHPVEGEFHLTAHDLDLGHPLLGRAARVFLDGDDEVAVQGWMGDVQPLGDDRYRFGLRLHLRGADHHIDAEGRTTLQPDGSVQVHGTCRVDPRDLGVPLPRLIPLHCLTDWDLRVVPEPGPTG